MDKTIVFIDDGFLSKLSKHFDKKRGSSFSLSNHLLKAVNKYIKLTKEDLNEK